MDAYDCVQQKQVVRNAVAIAGEPTFSLYSRTYIHMYVHSYANALEKCYNVEQLI